MEMCMASRHARPFQSTQRQTFEITLGWDTCKIYSSKIVFIYLRLIQLEHLIGNLNTGCTGNFKRANFKAVKYLGQRNQARFLVAAENLAITSMAQILLCIRLETSQSDGMQSVSLSLRSWFGAPFFFFKVRIPDAIIEEQMSKTL